MNKTQKHADGLVKLADAPPAPKPNAVKQSPVNAFLDDASVALKGVEGLSDELRLKIKTALGPVAEKYLGKDRPRG